MGVETGLLVASTAISAAGAIKSFQEADQQRQLQRQAQADAERAMADARKRLEVNYSAGLSVHKEPYELERDAALSAGAQAIEAGRESGTVSSAVGTAGRIQMAQNEAQAAIRTAEGKELSDLDKLTANEAGQLRDANANLSLGSAVGAQRAARDAQNAAAADTAAGWHQAANTVQGLVGSYRRDAQGNVIGADPGLIPLYLNKGGQQNTPPPATGIGTPPPPQGYQSMPTGGTNLNYNMMNPGQQFMPGQQYDPFSFYANPSLNGSPYPTYNPR